VFVSADSAPELEELSERARGASSFEEYRHHFLTSRYGDAFDRLCGHWGTPPGEEVYHRLRRIKVETVSEGYLRDAVRSRLASLVDAEPEEVQADLAQLALDNVYRELTALDIWSHLERLGKRRRRWSNDPHVLGTLTELNERYLQHVARNAILGRLIPWAEAATLLKSLADAAGARTVLVTGDAGSGKSGVVAEVVSHLVSAGTPILAFRLDGIDLAHAPEAIGRQMRLPDSPAAVLAGVAAGRECILVIDQLDAVSTVSGRQAQYLHAVERLLDEAHAHARMRVALACRRFDLEHDAALRLLQTQPGTERVVVAGLPVDTVRQIVGQLGLPADRLSTPQVRLLCVPFNLQLLTVVGQTAKTEALNFQTDQDLLDQFWDAKRDAVSVR
jgi:hypothetical protein